MLAFSLALRLDMPRPYWAMASVYITSNQLTGATWSKAAYRMLGTLIGAAATIALVPNLVNAPELLSLAIALWIGLCLYLSLIDGTPRSYAFMLSGYTVALLGFPVLSMPETTFDLVVSRVQEIMLGIICASAVSILVLPRTVASAIAAQASVWISDARRLGLNILTDHGSEPERDNERMRLACAASEIDQLSQHLGYENVTSTNTARGLNRLRQHMLALLPLLASVEDHRFEINRLDGVSANTAEISAKVARWLSVNDRDEPEEDRLRAAFTAAPAQLGADATWIEIMTAGYITRLGKLMDTVRDCGRLRDAIADGRNPDSILFELKPDALGAPVLHRDHGLALWAATATSISVLACCAFWIATGWDDGASAAVFAAVIGSLLAGVDDPLPTFRSFYGVFIAVIAINGIYTFAVLPQITTLEALIVALMPTYLLIGWMSARPATARVGSFLATFTTVQLALTSSYSADFASYANSSVALMVGVGLTGVISGIVRLFGARWIADRLLRSNSNTLAAVASLKKKPDRTSIASLMQHRLTLLATRISVVPVEARRDAANLRQLRTALNVIDLREISGVLSAATTKSINKLLAGLSSVKQLDAVDGFSSGIVGQLDHAMALTLREPTNESRNEALLGLAGIRLGLFPKAASYQPSEQEQNRAAA